MELICWCGSGKLLEKCHSSETWNLPSLTQYKVQLPPDITTQVKNNLLNYLNTSKHYHATDEGPYLKVASKEYYIEFFKQSIVASKEIGSRAFTIPAAFDDWAPIADKLSSNFVSSNLSKMNSIKDLKDINDFVNFKKAIGHIFFASSKKELVPNIKSISNKFLEFYPEGFVDFVSVDARNFKAPVMIRNFAKQNILGIELTKKLLESPWKEKTPMETGGAYFDIMYNIMGAGTYGFATPWLDRTLLLTFSTRVHFQMLSYATSYAKGAAIDFYESGIDKGEQVFALDPSDFRTYTAWYIRKLNMLLSYLTHIATFADRTSLFINPVKQYKHYLTWEELVILTIKIIGTEDLAIKKQLTFTFLDIIAHLNGGVIDHLFKKGFIEKMLNSFDDLPENFREQYKIHIKTVYKSLFDEVFTEVIPEYLETDTVKLSNKTLDKNSYVGAYISALRNTIHGYSGSRDYEEVIFINSGDIPIHLPEIVPILFQYLLIKPDVFFKSNIFTKCF